MATLFNGDNSDAEDELKINSGYANNYNSWRQKEELNKLKTRYGGDTRDLDSSADEDLESSTDEDEEGAALTEQVEKDFYKTLACLKKKDPKIYDDKVTFFQNSNENENKNGNEAAESKAAAKTSKKEKKLFLRDYERNIVVERGGKLSDSEDEETFNKKKKHVRAPTYVEEQRELKESIKNVLHNDDDEDDEDESNLLIPKAKTDAEKNKEEECYKKWLKGQQSETVNGEMEDLKALRDFWTDPDLDASEKFLRDYVLNKKFLDKDGTQENLDYEQIIHDSDENLSEDERNIEKQEEFEHKYNFRFEEPDQEFIKKYPRTLENSLRKKDTRRSQKRIEVKQRKEEEKVRKQEELKQLKALKRKEIADKIAKIKEITGNDDITIENIDLDGDFDPAEHDRKMQQLFNDNYYAAPEDDNKPQFPDIDEELGIETTWDDYDPNTDEIVPDDEFHTGVPHCEDPEFNMDADYDPTKTLQSELVESSRKKKKRRRSKFAEVIAKEKPKFDPNLHTSYREYIEQYYALDYEDMIDDLPCRFKYRNVVPNNYGLTLEEILMADDSELNKWCSLKKALEHKSEQVEMNQVRVYQQKAQNEAYKKKVLKSLYTPIEEQDDPETAIASVNQQNQESTRPKRKPKKKKKKTNANVEDLTTPTKRDEESKVKKDIEEKINDVSPVQNDAKRESKAVQETAAQPAKSSSSDKKKKRKAGKLDHLSQPNQSDAQEPQTKKPKLIIENATTETSNKNTEAAQKKKKKKSQKSDVNTKSKKQLSEKSRLKKGGKHETDQISLLSAERLKAYGINPKKFKNKLKYGKRR